MRRLVIVVLGIAALLSLPWWWSLRGERIAFELPHGFRGPAVVVFDDSNGITPQKNEEGQLVFPIPADGVLRARGDGFSGRYHFDYFEVDSAGNRHSLPTRVKDDSKLQVFSEVNGSADRTGISDLRWWAFVVGVPADRDDWKSIRRAHTEAAVWSRPDL